MPYALCAVFISLEVDSMRLENIVILLSIRVCLLFGVHVLHLYVREYRI